VMFAHENKALFDLMWRAALLDLSDRELLTLKERAFGVLDHRVRGADAAPVPHTDISMAATFACWSLVHGFARMALDGAFGATPAAVSKATKQILPASLDLLIAQLFPM
jgi:hypothetical protein